MGKMDQIVETRKKAYHFIKSWQCPEPIKEFISGKFEGRVLNLCCGEWACGDVNVDLTISGTNIYGDKIIKADILDPNFNLNERFDTVFCDPPWNWPYHFRARLNNAAANHLKSGGRFILNAPWPPRAFYLKVKEIYVMFKDAGLPSNAVLLGISEYTGKENV